MTDAERELRAALLQVIDAVSEAKGVNRQLLIEAWTRLVPETPPPPYPDHPLMPIGLLK